MLKEWLSRHRLAIVAIVGVVIALAIVGFSPTFHECVKANQEYQPGHSLQESLGVFIWSAWWCGGIFSKENGEALTAFASIAIGIFTYTLWWATTEQGRLTERAIDDANLSSQRQNRAYVSAIAKKMVLKPDDKTVIVLIDLENVGQTPAFETQGLANIAVKPVPPYIFNIGGKAPEDEGKPQPTFTLYPRAQHVSTPRHELTPKEIEQLEGGDFALWVFGRVTYIDAFHQPQWVEFCAFLEGQYYKDAMKLAKESPERRQVPVGFKFAAFGNKSSFT